MTALLWLWARWRYVLTGLGCMVLGAGLGHAAGHWTGERAGRRAAEAAQVVAQSVKNNKALKQREETEHDTRLLSDDAVDAELRRHGWMRPAGER